MVVLKMGDTKNQKPAKSNKKLENFCFQMGNTVTVKYLTSALNKRADLESSRRLDISE